MNRRRRRTREEYLLIRREPRFQKGSIFSKVHVIWKLWLIFYYIVLNDFFSCFEGQTVYLKKPPYKAVQILDIGFKKKGRYIKYQVIKYLVVTRNGNTKWFDEDKLDITPNILMPVLSSTLSINFGRIRWCSTIDAVNNSTENDWIYSTRCSIIQMESNVSKF